jgi:hypothetical protein
MKNLTMVRATISQEQLQLLVGIRNQIRQLTRLYDKESAPLLLRLLNGAKVERGLHHAEVETSLEGSAQIQKLVVY